MRLNQNVRRTGMAAVFAAGIIGFLGMTAFIEADVFIYG